MPGGSVRQAGPSPFIHEVSHYPRDCSGHPRSGVGWWSCHQGCFPNIITPHMSANRKPWESSPLLRGPVHVSSSLFRSRPILWREGLKGAKGYITVGTSSIVSFFGPADWQPLGERGGGNESIRAVMNQVCILSRSVRCVGVGRGVRLVLWLCHDLEIKIVHAVPHKRSPQMTLQR